MNKKFTTFLASAMLVSAFSVGTVAAYVASYNGCGRNSGS
jgi:Spy/CpxP family protein refolding chaperone